MVIDPTASFGKHTGQAGNEQESARANGLAVGGVGCGDFGSSDYVVYSGQTLSFRRIRMTLARTRAVPKSVRMVTTSPATK